MLRIAYFLLIPILFLSSCSGEYHPVSIDFFQNDTIPFREKLQKALEPEHLKEMGFSEEQTVWLQDYYEKNAYKSLWVNDSMISITKIVEIGYFDSDDFITELNNKNNEE